MSDSDHPTPAEAQNNNRRKFIKTLGGLGIGAGTLSALSQSIANDTEVPSRIAGARYMGDFVAARLETIKVAIIGLGSRGKGHCNHLSLIDGTEVVGLCDLYEDLCKKAKEIVLKNGKGRHGAVKLYHGDENAYKTMLLETKPDLVYVITPWKLHAPMAIDAMNSGAHTCMEVPACLTIEEAWQLIDTAERTQKHCMMLENVNYGREELLFLNMCRQGIFGELLHAEAGYIHELRAQMHSKRGTGSWRTYEYANRNGNLYPTHGLGPVAQYMNLGRGDDHFGRITSFSTPARGRALYAGENFPAEHKWNNIEFKGGDLSTSIIKTHLGRTIMVQWDETSPRPYTRLNLIQGTRGTGAGYPTRIALDYKKGELPDAVFNALAGKGEDHTDYHEWAEDEKLQSVYEAWDHPLYRRMSAVANKVGGHGGMDFIMNSRVIEAIRLGQPLDQNVYEGVYWSAVAPLSEASVAADGAPQDFPDFTRGSWKNTKPLAIVS
ncbi:Gfo/Idh/MocA family protein [Luteolibacter algae]|uniref:Gfo/Idh/MocA family protein n=1 Tax=Luteolibacter algae TaxID=454151 RepID=A0ABW5D706_9BACT